MADRYLYVPLAGVGLIAAGLQQGAGSAKTDQGLRAFCLLPFCFALLFLNTQPICTANSSGSNQQHCGTDALLQSIPGLAPALLGMANVHYRAGDFASGPRGGQPKLSSAAIAGGQMLGRCGPSANGKPEPASRHAKASAKLGPARGFTV